ncbi:hypothetical protein WICPIJ_004052 [Wickerhamomyces pijperi]|uniref:PCI domain-containing protein n=1 Tax=Wickerhamomyces pijperi TaxID=599730 RepID=A0A9P8Q6E6_WICPI|nr:hypothetical protein WICPIJ_004052 [Wickerhamomyces pijperi]
MSLTDQILHQLQDTTTFGFNEIRLNPDYEQLLKEDKLLSNTIELFCFGDYQYYMDNQSSLLQLPDAALNKIRKLTLLSEALKSNCFSYEHLKSKVFIDSNSELERLLTESIYQNIIEAKINSYEQLIKINTTQGRDILLTEDPNFTDIQRKFPNVQTDKDLLEKLAKFKLKIAKANEYLDDIKNSFDIEKIRIDSSLASDTESSAGASNDISNITIGTSGGSETGPVASLSSALHSSRKRKSSK